MSSERNNTNNPVPSDATADLQDNCCIFDEFMNLNLEFVPQGNRFGQQMLTRNGAVAKFIMTPLNGGVWAAGIDFTAFNQYMIYNGVAYKVKWGTTLPYTSTATPDVNFVEPFTLESAAVANLATLVFDTVNDLQNGVPAEVSDGYQVRIKSRNNALFDITTVGVVDGGAVIAVAKKMQDRHRNGASRKERQQTLRPPEEAHTDRGAQTHPKEAHPERILT